MLVLAVLMITAGRLGDLRGRRNLFIVGIAIFPREQRGAALRVWGGVAALATIAGPTVGARW